jgi:hypothetical protein
MLGLGISETFAECSRRESDNDFLLVASEYSQELPKFRSSGEEKWRICSSWKIRS